MMLVFALIGLVGIVCLMLGIMFGLNPESKHGGGWLTVFIIGLVFLVIGWVGGLAIQDIEEDATRTQYEYQYNYCPHCGEQLKGD